MAFEYQNFASLGVNLNRQKYGPLDISNVFNSEADLKYYLTKGTFTEGVSDYWIDTVPYPYEGQVIATVIDGAVNVFVLALNENNEFITQEISGKIEVDGDTIEIAADGSIKLVGIDGLATTKDDGEGNQVTITYQPRYKNGKLTWEELSSTTIEDVGAQLKGLEEDINNLEKLIPTDEEITEIVDSAAAKFNKAAFEKVEFLPDPLFADPNVLYLLPVDDKFEIYAKVGDELILIDDTDVSLEGYATTEDIKDFVKKDVLNNYLLSSVLDTLVSKDGFEEVLNASTTIEALIEAANKSHEHENKTVLDSITQNLIDKWNLGEANVIGSVDSEEFTLQDKALAIKLISAEKISGLTEKISTAIEEHLKDFNGTILDSISINDVALEIDENKNIDLPIANNTTLGLVYAMGATGDNKVSIEEDGTLSVKSVNVNTLAQNKNEFLILNGGNAALTIEE